MTRRICEVTGLACFLGMLCAGVLWAAPDAPDLKDAPRLDAFSESGQAGIQTTGWRAAFRVDPFSSGIRRSAAGGACGDPSVDFLPTGEPPEGDGPSAVVFTADGTRIIIAHRDSQNLVVFDAATRDVLHVIPLSGSPNSLALSSDGVHAVTANLFEDTASIVDLTTESEIAVVPVGDQPGVVRITPDGATAVVGNTLDSDLSIIDITSATETTRIPGAVFSQILSFGSWGGAVKFTGYEIAPDNTTLIFPDMFNSAIQFFDIVAETVNTVPSAPNPAVVDLCPDGTVAVVSHHFPQTNITVLDVPSQTITNVYPTGGSAGFVPPIAISADKTKAVVAVQNNVRVINLSTGATSGDLFTGSVNAMEATADGQYAVVANFMGSIVSFASETIVANTLSTTTPDYLGVSPVDPRAATAHILRKEFMEVMNVSGAAGFLEEVVPTGPPPEGDKSRGVAISPDGATAVMIHNHSHNAVIMDLDDQTNEAFVAVGERPGGVAITPDGSKAVVANLDSTFATVIDIAGASATNISISRRGSQVAISPDGMYAYIPVVASGDGVWRINLDTDSVDGPKILTGNMGGVGFVFDQASGMALSHDGGTLVTCGSFDNNVSIIDTAAWSEVARVTVGDFPVKVTFSTDDSEIYVTNRNNDTVSVVSNAGAGSTLLDTINVGDFPFVLTTNPAGTRLYVSNFFDASISVIDLNINTVVDTIPLPTPEGAGQPVGLHVSADGTALYVAANGGDFHIIDTASNTISETLSTGRSPTELVFHDATQRGFMPAPLGDDGLVVVNIGTPVLGDLDGDCAVGAFDLALLLGSWGPCPEPCTPGPPETTCPADFDGDCIVGAFDLALLLGNWGP